MLTDIGCYLETWNPTCKMKKKIDAKNKLKFLFFRLAAEVVGVKAATVLELNPAAIKLQVWFLSGKIYHFTQNEKSGTVTFQDK